MSGKFLSIEDCKKVVSHPEFKHLLNVLQADDPQEQLSYYHEDGDWVAAGENCKYEEDELAVCFSVFVNEVLNGNDSDTPTESQE